MKKLPVLPLVVFASVATATGLVLFLANPIHAAQKSGGVVISNASGRAAPISSVAEFDKAFTSRLNATIKQGANRVKGGDVVDTYIGPLNISTKFTKWETARLISKTELEKLRSDLSARLKEASAKRTALNDIANGSIGDNFFEGKIVARKTVKAEVKTDAKKDLKPGN